MILPGGHIKRVPPRGPATELLTLAANFGGQELTGDIALGLAQRRSALRSIVSLCEQLYEDSDIVSSSPPRVKKTRPKPR